MSNIDFDKLNAEVPQEPAPEQLDKPSAAPVANVTAKNSFTEAVDRAKVTTLEQAAANDRKFNEDFIGKIKEATLKLAEVEKEKATLEKQNIEYRQELLDTQQRLNEQEQAANLWENRQKRREYHFAGVQPIMEFVGIKKPMNLFLLYFLTFVLVWFFLLDKLFKGTIGALIAGASDSDRPKAVKGFIWTVIGIVFIAVAALGIFLVLKWLGVITL